MTLSFRRLQNCDQHNSKFIFLFVLFAITCWLYSQTSRSSPRISHKPYDPCHNINGLEAYEPKLVTCLRNKFLEGPSLQPYNLTNPTIVNPSQFQPNILALRLLRNKKNGLFIEAGALDGEFMSNTLYLERTFGWTGLLIEPDAVSYAALMSKHRKSWTSCTCLSLNTIAEKLNLMGYDYYVAKDGVSPERIIERFRGYGYTQRAPREVQCFPLYTYFLALGITEVDYFSFYAEGRDFEVLKTIPFDKIIFKVLEVEAYWTAEGESFVRSYLEARGYIYIHKIDVDLIFIHTSVKLPAGFVI